MKRFRYILYIPDPFLPTRLVIGAQLEVDGHVEFIRAPLWFWESLMPAARALLDLVMSTRSHRLADATAPSRSAIPSVGLHFLTDRWYRLPANWPDAREWVLKMFEREGY